ncbi:glutathione S-transferase family protein [Sphingomonas sp. LaA6.9]|uniref:glutathione S-transferase family protein n=1 Tax=Sphingomonas sp. LaA6.9 TaxID=2919914 RepID=UPI001F4FF886|nr:glutathione S-transferase family protein [Sphingomonas sp. LaA6.9]MCJ8159446.1 glutathione S-transferase family protein [Sphingomonas sp. LaA6.9]
MSRTFYGHPLSSYCQKALIALYEHGVPFDWRVLSPDDPQAGAEFSKLWPMEHMPVLVDGARVLRESSVVIEYVDRQNGGGLIPADPDAALNVRFLDRFFDNFVMSPVQAIVFDRIRPDGAHDDFGVERMRQRLDKAYGWLEGELGDGWAAGEDFTLADCAASPSLFYASKIQPLGGRFPGVAAYLERLEARPAIARVREEAQPYWTMFPFAD